MQDRQPDSSQSYDNTQFPPNQPNPPSLTQAQKRLLREFQDNKSNTSTYHSEIALQDIPMKTVYVLQRNLLQNTRITPNIRAKIRSFIMDECSKQLISRDTGALACTYIDLYFRKKGFCQVQEIQTMAISCLMLARKQQEGKAPTISYNVFSKESILRWEAKVAKKLQYRLLPPTYITFGQHVVKKWELFTSNQTKFIKKFTDSDTGPNLILRSFYEQLDCMQLGNCILILQTFSWELQNVILNMFYLHIYLLNVPHTFRAHQLSDQEFFQTFYSETNEFYLFFNKFLQNYSKLKRFSLNSQLGLFLKKFLGLNASRKEFGILNTQPKYKSLRVWDKLQTYNHQAYQLAKGIMERIRNS